MGSTCSAGSGRHEKVLEVKQDVNALVDSHRKAVVGRTVDLDTLIYFDRLLKIGKVKFSKIQYLGGLSILVSFGSTGEAVSFLENKELWGPWFSNLDLWEGQILAVERIAWLRIQGIPLHLFDSEILRMVGNLFGKALYVPSNVGDDQDLSVKCVGVLAGLEPRIMEVVRLKWRDRWFRLWVSEEENVWIPDCLGSSELESSELERKVSEEGNSGKGGDTLHGDYGVDYLFEEDGVNSEKSFMGNEEPDVTVNMGPIMKEAACSHAFNVGDGAGNKKENKDINSSGAKVFKRRKGKSVQSSLGSPNDIRPKKRLSAQLEKEDLFGLDDLISKGPFHCQNTVEHREDADGMSATGEINASLDLNRRASLPAGRSQSESESNTDAEERNEEAIAGFNLVDEVAATILVGAQLGVDLHGNQKLVEDSIQGEGINVFIP
ncbi:hypothetical protein HanHA300_Chr16g0595011 [Helianthus annuus]|nr:hypothetical protein HanHA300_Chr16g0595011 [Helianthus annuus]KAJ0441087.1 hypothetical protein HanIR_Chr16g0793791 [Helianthus annuus]KAJ0819759.1 hypothetical protein HanPSC8_Chr16g0699781 [Helianthus annuus]